MKAIDIARLSLAIGAAAIVLASCTGSSLPTDADPQNDTTQAVETVPQNDTTQPVETAPQTSSSVPATTVPPDEAVQPIASVRDAIGAPTGTEVRLFGKAVFTDGVMWLCGSILESGIPSCGEGIEIVGIGVDAFGETQTFFAGTDIWSVEPITVAGVIHDGLVVAISSQPPNDTSEPIERVPDALGAPTGTEVRLVSKAVFEDGEVWMCSLILETGAPSRCGNGIQIVGIGLEAFGETETFFGGPGIRAVEPITVVGVIHDGVVVAISSESS